MNHPYPLEFAGQRNRGTPVVLEASALAAAMLEALGLAQAGGLVLHQSPLHCDGFAPVCLAAGDWRAARHDHLLGHLAGVPLWASAGAASYWAGCTLVLDMDAGEAPAHSLESGSGYRFVLRVRHSAPSEKYPGGSSTTD